MQKSNLFRVRTIMKAWKFYFSIYKRKSRLAAYTRNTLHRKKMIRLFTSWKTVTNHDFRLRLDKEKRTFRTDLENKILVQWSTKVDALLLYVAELEDKIRQEQEAREQMARTYDQSLDPVYTRLAEEMELLSKNPLVREANCDISEVEDPNRITVEQRRLAIQARMMNELNKRKLSSMTLSQVSRSGEAQIERA